MAKVIAKRSYGLTADDVKVLAAEFKQTKKFPNPHNKGNYRFILASLLSLGANKFHSLKAVATEFAAIAGSDFMKAYKNKEAHSEDNAKNADERFVQNLTVLQRTDYGLRIMEVGKKVLKSKGAVIDMQRSEKGIVVRLNLNSDEPLKMGRQVAEKTVKPSKASKVATPAKNGAVAVIAADNFASIEKDAIATIVKLGEKAGRAKKLIATVRKDHPTIRTTDGLVKRMLAIR